MFLEDAAFVWSQVCRDICCMDRIIQEFKKSPSLQFHLALAVFLLFAMVVAAL